MKKWILLTFALLLCLSACTPQPAPTTTALQAPEKLDMEQVYTRIIKDLSMPEMMLLGADQMLDYCGIQSADCRQAVVSICADGLRTDEIWLIEAVDADALARLKTAAENRLQQKADESKSYSPEQYAVVQKAQTISSGNYLAVLVSPDVDAMAAAFRAAANTN